MEARIAALDPASRRLFLGLTDGAYAATCATRLEAIAASTLEQIDDAPAPEPRVWLAEARDEEALASIRLRVPGESAARTWVCPLAKALEYAVHGATIEEVRAPDGESWTWAGLAAGVTEDVIRAGPIVPFELRYQRIWLVWAQDFRGLTAALGSELPTSDGSPLGKRLTNLLSRSTIPGVRADRDAAYRALGADEFAGDVVGAVAEYLLTRADALHGMDGGAPLVEWHLWSLDPLGQDWHEVAGSSTPAPSATHRRGRLSSTAIAAAVCDAFGSGLLSPRAQRRLKPEERRRFVSLDAPIGGQDATSDGERGTTHGDRLPVEPDVARTVAERLDLAALAVAAKLTRRERQVLGLLVDDVPEVAIAERLGLSPATVAVHVHNLRRKLRAVREEEFLTKGFRCVVP